MSTKDIIKRVICVGREEVPKNLSSLDINHLDVFVSRQQAAAAHEATLTFNPEFKEGAVDLDLSTNNMAMRGGASERVEGKISAKCAQNLLEALLQWKYGA